MTIGDRPDQPFSSGQSTFPTKKDAKSAAAQSAVIWLRIQGKLEETSEKKRRTSNSAGEAQTQAGSNDSSSVAQRVHELTAALGFLQPRWETTPSTGSSGQTVNGTGAFIDMAAHFNERDVRHEPRLQGPIGQVRHCFGKQKAKQACCELVLPVLEAIKRDRLAAGR